MKYMIELPLSSSDKEEEQEEVEADNDTNEKEEGVHEPEPAPEKMEDMLSRSSPDDNPEEQGITVAPLDVESRISICSSKKGNLFILYN
jgi:hypothetical protein